MLAVKIVILVELGERCLKVADELERGQLLITAPAVAGWTLGAVMFDILVRTIKAWNISWPWKNLPNGIEISQSTTVT